MKGRCTALIDAMRLHNLSLKNCNKTEHLYKKSIKSQYSHLYFSGIVLFLSKYSEASKLHPGAQLYIR